MEAKKVYDKFVKDRNKALEVLLNKSRAKITRELRVAFDFMAHAYQMMDHPNTHMLQHVIFSTSVNIERIVKKLRRQTRILTITSEYEILGRVGLSKTNKPISVPEGKEHKDLYAGGTIQRRVTYYLNQIVRKLDALSELAKMNNEKLSPEEIASAFPKRKKIPRTKVIRRLTEAKKKNGEDDDTNPDDTTDADDQTFNVTTDLVSDQEWNSLVDDYLSTNIPQDRSGATSFSDQDMIDAGLFPSGTTNAIDESVTYDWELERDVTHDFIDTVRDGQMEAANEAGVDDFVWVAILDDKTDDCCAWRDGLTTSEIEDELSGKHSGDDCPDAVTPPAHFNCATAGHIIEGKGNQILIENISPGDEVLTHLGRFKKVTRCVQSVVNEIIEIETTQTTLNVTPEHPLLTKNRGWVLAKDLTTEDDLVLGSDILRKEPKDI